MRKRHLLIGAAVMALVASGAGMATGAGLATAQPRDVPPIDVQFSTDFSGGWDGWQDTPWNDEPQGEVARPAVVDSPTGTGKAARFHLDGGQKRNESQPDAAQSINDGDTLVVEFTDYLEDGFPVGTDDWQVVMQFKNDGTGSPPCEIKVGHGQYYLDGNNGSWHYDIGPAVTGRPIDIAVQITFTADPATSVLNAWYDGTQSVTDEHPSGAGTLYSGLSSYLKTGIYRDTAIGDDGTRYLTNLVIGTPA